MLQLTITNNNMYKNFNYDPYQQDVCHDWPVEVEGDLAEEDEGESEEDVGPGVKEVGEDEDGREDKAESADQRVRPRELLPQAGTQQSTQGYAQHSGYHSYGAKDKWNTENWIELLSDRTRFWNINKVNAPG